MMTRRTTHFVANNNGDDKSKAYTIGYGKPPEHSRFRTGQTGNPAGRPKGVRNLGTDVRRTLKVPVKINEGGRSRKISTQAGMLMLLRERALKGNGRALDRLIELANRFNNEPTTEATQAISTDDKAILAAYAAEIAGSPALPPSQKSNRRLRIKPRRRTT
jgi:Family of unknown function (DUF5681)